MANDMVTRCARAISETGAASNWEQAVQAARAMLEAMRVPTDGMIATVEVRWLADAETKAQLRSNFIEDWETAIDTALSQEGE